MARPHAIEVGGTVVDTRPNGVCRVRLANGHVVLAWGAARAGVVRPAPGDRLRLELSPCDLSQGRVVRETKH